jgi:hypothetical protein
MPGPAGSKNTVCTSRMLTRGTDTLLAPAAVRGGKRVANRR